MKKQIQITLLLFFFLSFSSSQLQAQNQKGTWILSTSFGTNYAEKAERETLHALRYSTKEIESQRSSTAVLQAHLDYAMNTRWSLGVSASHQKLQLKHSYLNAQNRHKDLQLRGSRVSLGLRAIVHYGIGRNDKLNLYSGIRLGYRLYQTAVRGNTEFTASDFENSSLLSFQLIALGMRFFYRDDIAFHLEAAAGQPYFLSAGFSFKIK